MIKAVVFDIDGVLMDSYEANFKFFQVLMEKTGFSGKPTREEFPGLFHLSLHDAIREITQLKDEVEIKRIWEIGKNREVPYDLSLVSLPDSCEKVLTELGKSYRLAIVTSRISTSVYEFPALAELQSHFEIAVAHEDTDNHKPHPDPLLHAAKKMSLRPEECVYIGDMESDIAAAKAANMKVILYSKNYIEGADAETDKFSDLPTLINALG